MLKIFIYPVVAVLFLFFVLVLFLFFFAINLFRFSLPDKKRIKKVLLSVKGKKPKGRRWVG